MSMAAEFQESGCDALVALTRVHDPQRFGVSELDAQGKVVKLVEKPKQPKSDLGLVGM